MGTPLDNQLLAALPRNERAGLGLKDVRLESGQMLYELGGRIEAVYFPVTAMVSLMVPMSSGATVEVAGAGREAMVGLEVFLGVPRALTRMVVGVRGMALQADVSEFRAQLLESPALSRLLGRYAAALLAEMSRLSACNRLHTVQARMARLLLRDAETSVTGELTMTHERLAGKLGVSRPVVIMTAAALQELGVVQYRRGKIRILDSKALAAKACECYGDIRDKFGRLFPEGAYVEHRRLHRRL